MSRDAEAIIAALDELSPSEREQVVAEIIRRVALSDHSGPSDEELATAADEVFQALDRREDSGT